VPDATIEPARIGPLLQAAVNVSRDALVVFDADQRPVLWNDALLQMLQLAPPRDEVPSGAAIVRRLSDYVENFAGSPFRRRWDLAEESGCTSDVVTAEDGRVFERIARPCPVGDGVGRLVCYRERTDPVSSVQLANDHALAARLQANKMEAIGRLAGGVAHDFNNVLTAIAGHADLLGDEIGTHPGLQEIISAAGSGARLTRQLLAFSRQQHLRPTVLDVGQIVRGITGMLRRLIGEDIELAVDVAAQLPAIKADPGQLEQIIVNLVVNARDAMPEGGTIRLSASPLDWTGGNPRRGVMPHGAYVAIRVEDTGNGIDEEVLPHVFEPFFTTKGTGGTGLGLATVYGIVKQSGGFVWVDSRLGRGTSFSVEFPAAQGAGDAPSVPLDHVPAIGPGAKTILVVEDQDNVRRIVVRFLQSEGHRILDSASPADALQLLADTATTIDLLVTDVVMPGMPGNELSRRLRERWPTLRTVYMSGFSNEHLEAAPDALFVPKPFNRAALVNKVREALSWAESR